MKNNVLVLFLLLGIFYGSAQTNLNDYKYVVVPGQYAFLKSKDKYRLNSLTRFLLRKHGFNAFMEEEIKEEDYKKNNCLALRADVVNIRSMLNTKLKVVLKNCNGEIIFESEEGKTKIKDYEDGYKDALRKAFKSFEGVGYAYNPSNAIANNTSTEAPAKDATEVAALKAEIEELKRQKQLQAEKEKQTIAQETEAKRKMLEAKAKKEAVVEEVAEVKAVPKTTKSNLLYAQELANGYQLVDSTPKVVYKMIKTGLDNVFLVENLSAIIYRQGDSWVLEYHSGSTLVKEVLNVKF